MASDPTFSPTDEQNAILGHDATKHARVLAGPGTGKSSTLIAYLGNLKDSHNPLRGRLLTFTRATAAELAKKAVDDAESDPVPTSTIHSFAISVLLANQGSANLPMPLRVADDWERGKIIHPNLAKRTGLTVPRIRKLEREMASNWEHLSEKLDPDISPQERNAFLGAWHEDRRLFGYTLLSELPFALLNAVRQHDDLVGIDYDILVVDEYQDLNACDLQLIAEMAKRGCAIMSVGDDDQSIYSFRNADPAGIRDFIHDYDNPCDYELSVGLRCGSDLLEWAKEVISRDPSRKVKTDMSAAPSLPTGDLGLLRFGNHNQEAFGIRDLVLGLIDREGIKPEEILILFRSDYNGTFSSLIVNALGAAGVEVGDPDRVQRILAGDRNRALLGMIRLCVDPDDSLAWATLLNLKAGIGQRFFDYVLEEARQASTRFGEMLMSLHQRGYPEGPRSAGKVGQYVESVLSWIDAQDVPQDEDVKWGEWIIGTADGLLLQHPTEELADLLLQIDGIEKGVQSLGQFVGQIEPRGKDLARASDSGVRLMTMGAAKGLTVKATILVGLENEVIPHPKGLYEEECRLLYVGMSRATHYLYGTWARRRTGRTARVGTASVRERRSLTEFLEGTSVQAVDGDHFLRSKGWR